MRVVVRGRRWRQRGLGAVSLSDPNRRRHGRLDELMSGRGLAKECLHPPPPTLVHYDHLDDLLTLDKCLWAEVPRLDRAEQSRGRSQGEGRGLNAGVAQLIGLQPVVN